MKRIIIVMMIAAVLDVQAVETKRNAKSDSDLKKPNIVLVLTDDLGYSDIGCYGSPKNRTPHIDRLAKSGIRMTDFYAAASVCSPSRAGILTGKYPILAGVPTNVWTRNLSKWFKDFGLDSRQQLSMAKMLKSAGYATACIGKWHLGESKYCRPLANGFDEFFGLPPDRGDVPAGKQQFQWYRNNDPLELADKDLVTQRCTQEAISFIEKRKNQPFFLYLAHPMPHITLGASEAFKGKSGNGLYCDVIEELDWSVGQIVEKLKKEGLTENTIVIFTSDNGPWVDATGGLLKDGTPRWGTSKPLKKWKFCYGHEGGSRVPFIVSWPRHIKAGRTSHALISALDLFPTFAELAKVPPEAAWNLDGTSQTRLWLAGSDNPKDENALTTQFFYFATPFKPRRKRDKSKYHFDVSVSVDRCLSAVRVGRWKYVRYIRKAREAVPVNRLFDIAEDKEENTNLYDKFPEISARLAALCDKEEARWQEGWKNLEATK